MDNWEVIRKVITGIIEHSGFWFNVLNAITNIIILAISSYTFYLTIRAKRINAYKPSFNSSRLNGNYISVLLQNKTLHSFAIKEVFLLSRIQNVCYDFLIKKYDIPLILKPWETVYIEQLPFAHILNYDRASDMIKDCAVMIIDIEGNEIMASGKFVKEDRWFKRQIAEKQISTPILISKYMFGKSVSDSCLYSVIIRACTDNNKENRFIIVNTGHIYEGEQVVGCIDLSKDKDNIDNVREQIKEMFNISDNTLIVEKIEKGAYGFATTVRQTSVLWPVLIVR